ncbi:hypothetical protein [Accumulibacter sp.]|uniref:hypothetical protein n=1 Tax=Candidatus Accumulibacter TaxID=327159 RepID=UPI0019014216|nr:hypothetical protein [Accumulibacter sp.]MBN8498789.1 hypothetical protein [Accumulibacter sp.]MBO3717057.1 hypothetical protein [Accumulibacter sp.]
MKLDSIHGHGAALRVVTESRLSPAGLTRCAQLTIVANQVFLSPVSGVQLVDKTAPARSRSLVDRVPERDARFVAIAGVANSAAWRLEVSVARLSADLGWQHNGTLGAEKLATDSTARRQAMANGFSGENE